MDATLDGADFHHIAAGYDSGAVYLLSGATGAQSQEPGIYGKHGIHEPWKRAAMRGLVGEVKAIAVHPSESATLVVGPQSGLFLSRNSGDRFVRISSMRPVFAASFDRS